MTVINLPLCPSSNNLFAGNGRRRYRTDAYKAWVEEAGWEITRQRPPQSRGQVSLLIEVREPPTQRQEDLANREKAMVDLLVGHGVIQGDSQRYVRQITMGWSTEVVGIRITVKPWTE